MTAALIVFLSVVIVLALVRAVPIISKLLRRCGADEITQEWVDAFSASAYRPMEVLLDDEDFKFLSTQPGFDFSLYKKLRRDRLRIFRQYLDRMIIDFNRLHMAARVLVSRCEQDQSEVMWSLLKAKAEFSVLVFQAEANYSLCLLGLRTIAARQLIVKLEEMNAQFVELSAAQPA